MFKAAFGFSLITLSAVGALLPLLGIASSFGSESAAALVGGAIGAFLAFRA